MFVQNLLLFCYYNFLGSLIFLCLKKKVTFKNLIFSSWNFIFYYNSLFSYNTKKSLVFLLLSWGQIECSVWGLTDLHYAAVTLVKTMVGDCNMEKMIATVSRELTISLPLKWLLQRWGPVVLPLAVSFCIQSNVGASRLSACDWMGES